MPPAPGRALFGGAGTASFGAAFSQTPRRLDSPSALITAWIGLGSNLGDRRNALDEATRRLRALMTDLRVSASIETEAVDRHGCPDPAAPRYLNAAGVGRFDGTPRELLEALQRIEREMGRPPEEKSRYLPRAIDLDILLVEEDGRNVAIDEPDLVVPHPRLLERPFCLEPLRALGMDVHGASAVHGINRS